MVRRFFYTKKDSLLPFACWRVAKKPKRGRFCFHVQRFLPAGKTAWSPFRVEVNEKALKFYLFVCWFRCLIFVCVCVSAVVRFPVAAFFCTRIKPTVCQMVGASPPSVAIVTSSGFSTFVWYCFCFPAIQSLLQKKRETRKTPEPKEYVSICVTLTPSVMWRSLLFWSQCCATLYRMCRWHADKFIYHRGFSCSKGLTCFCWAYREENCFFSY